MKLFVVLALALLLICMVQARKCPRGCPSFQNPVCAFNGDCVRWFGNPCMLAATICQGFSEFYRVPLKYCDTRRKCGFKTKEKVEKPRARIHRIEDYYDDY